MNTDLPHEVSFEGVHVQLAVRRPAAGVVVVRISGSDVGELGAEPFRAIDEDLARFEKLELFVDARDVKGASVDVSNEWARWLGAHRARLKGITMLTGSRYVQITADFVRRFAGLGELMHIDTDPATFEAKLVASIELARASHHAAS